MNDVSRLMKQTFIRQQEHKMAVSAHFYPSLDRGLDRRCIFWDNIKFDSQSMSSTSLPLDEPVRGANPSFIYEGCLQKAFAVYIRQRRECVRIIFTSLKLEGILKLF